MTTAAARPFAKCVDSRSPLWTLQFNLLLPGDLADKIFRQRGQTVCHTARILQEQFELGRIKHQFIGMHKHVAKRLQLLQRRL